MEIGLFFGSFNPIHTGHLIIASHVLNYTSLNKIWFVVSPQNPLKDSCHLLDATQRLKLVGLAVDNDDRFLVSDVEFQLPKPSYTIDTVHYLQHTYPENRFRLIIGSDNLLDLPRWKSHEKLLEEANIIVYLRPGYPVDASKPGIEVLSAAQLDISSTKIRELIRNGKSARYLVPDVVLKEIVTNNYYR
ncbi:MAG TPA: nicotinate (nicotinamide) nucleotide adenylyltransferase [Parafilimonas sp.]|nr:nicotinate (nicotinamide) nucleotide adenylyltransferase [Parafilimonas sp.]